MRLSYKKIIEKFAMEFSSSPVLCTVSESIETLEGRDEWALETDIFSMREESPNEEKKVNEKEKVETSFSASSALASSSSSSSA